MGYEYNTVERANDRIKDLEGLRDYQQQRIAELEAERDHWRKHSEDCEARIERVNADLKESVADNAVLFGLLDSQINQIALPGEEYESWRKILDKRGKPGQPLLERLENLERVAEASRRFHFAPFDGSDIVVIEALADLEPEES